MRFQLNSFQELFIVQACPNNYMSLRYRSMCSSSFNSTLGDWRAKKSEGGKGRKISFKSWSLQGKFIFVLCGHTWQNTSVKLVKLTRVRGKTYP